MENEAAATRRIKTIASHFAQEFSSLAPLLVPVKCSGSLNNITPRCDSRLYFARQDSASLPFFMREHHPSPPPPPPPPPPPSHQPEKAMNGSFMAEPPLFSRPRRSVDPSNPQNLQTKGETELPKFARPELHPVGNEWSPRMDVAESGRSYVINVEIPGVNANDIRVELSHTNLRITGKRRMTAKSLCAYHKREITQGPYQVFWPLPADANTDRITAEFFDGILQVIVPKL